jgi:ubiquinone/menaquinone biosynthesis C-methylase UbiE
MLPRTLEPEVMDSAAEARDYDAMDHGEVNRVFVADFLAAGGGPGPVLDVGTGTAQIPIELCRQHPGARVTAVDMAGHMLAVARENVRRAGLGGRIALERCDAKRLPFGDGSFAAVMSNSIVHHIARPEAVLAEMVRVVRPGGLLFVRDLLRPDDGATLGRLVDLHAAGANAHQRQMFADSLHAALTLAEVRGLVAGLGFDPATVSQTTDRHWTWAANGRRRGRLETGPYPAGGQPVPAG